MKPLSRPNAVVSLAALALVLVALVHGCDTGSTLDNRRFPCAQDDECVAGYLCRQGECRPEGEPPDDPDGGRPDGGTDGGPDSGVPDGGDPDSGVPDSGVPDSGVPDAGPVVRPTKISFVSPPQAVDLQACSPAAVELETQTASGVAAPVAAQTTVNLRARNNDLLFYPNDRCSAQQVRTTATIPAGGSRASFYFRGSAVGVSPIDVFASGLGAASQSQVIRNGVPTAVAFVSPAQTVSAGVCSAEVVLEVRNATGGATAFATATPAGLTLSPAGGPSLYSDASCTTAITDATFAAGATQARFYFRGVTGGTFILGAKPSTLPQVTQPVTILPVVRTGTCMLPDGVSAVDCPISPAQLDMAKTMLLFQATSNSADPSSSNVACALKDTSTVTCGRFGTGGVVNVAWQTAELASGLRVQHLAAACGGLATLDVPIPQPVGSLANTFLLVSSLKDGTSLGEDDFFTGHLHATDHVDLQFSVPCTPSWQGSVQVVEFTSASVTRGVTGPMSTGETVLTVTGLPAAAPSTTALLFTYRVANATQPGICDRALRGEITSASTLTFTRSNEDLGCANATIEAISWERINLGDRGRAQHLRAELNDTLHNIQLTIPTAVDTTRTLVFASNQALSGQGGGETDFTGDDILGAVIARHTLVAPNRVEIRRDFTGDADTRWFSTVLQLNP